MAKIILKECKIIPTTFYFKVFWDDEKNTMEVYARHGCRTRENKCFKCSYFRPCIVEFVEKIKKVCTDQPLADLFEDVYKSDSDF